MVNAILRIFFFQDGTQNGADSLEGTLISRPLIPPLTMSVADACVDWSIFDWENSPTMDMSALKMMDPVLALAVECRANLQRSAETFKDAASRVHVENKTYSMAKENYEQLVDCLQGVDELLRLGRSFAYRTIPTIAYLQVAASAITKSFSHSFFTEPTSASDDQEPSSDQEHQEPSSDEEQCDEEQCDQDDD